MDTYALHLAMAALVGASFVAVSAYYMHRKTLSQLLEFARAVERERAAGGGGNEDGGVERDGETYRRSSLRRGHQSHSRRKGAGYYRRGGGSVSLPDVILAAEVDGEEEDEEEQQMRPAMNGPLSAAAIAEEDHRSLPIPPGLPRLHTVPEGSKQSIHVSSNKKAGHIRPTSPRSPVASGSAFESVEGSDEEENLHSDSKLDNTYLHTNGDIGPEHKSIYQAMPNQITDNGDSKPLPAASMIRSHSVSGNMHGAQPDPVAADILRKEPEQETFVRLKITPSAEVYKILQKCLELRESYLFREEVAPWEKEVITDPSTPKPNPNPFAYTPEKKTDHFLQMVDGVVHVYANKESCMNQKHLLRFIKSKLRKEPDEVVIFRDGTYMTLKEVFESLDLTGYDLNVDLLDVHADKSTFHRFDKFNLKYNPCGQSRLREIFLKQDNLIQGRFLGELTKQVFSDLAASKYQMAEYRLSIYGRKQSEWDQLASWIVNNELYSENVVWLIQIPRLYNVYKEMGIVTSFQNILDNIFLPLFEVTVDPESHPQLHVFLKQVVGLDLVDDESKPERRPTKHMPTPAQWTNVFNPAFSYYVYYCYANLYTLNKLRELKGMTTIKFRPHSGEAGDIDHLAATFLVSHNIAHGINLRKSPVLQYLYYLAQLWKLSACDLCEIARNSVLQSGFSHALKSHWIGRTYYKRGPDGNDIRKTNVPHIRVEFREMIWREEMQLVYLGMADLPEELDR
ncbi:AMP deaminase [Cocos nucifera]|uniref:AMP deaminase n=1 Tax=Cocos nucifera TaxID=13894 RepID=A0A8K0I732_COCNU|nr:AMP deaminase [Cocos nucifera]